MSKPSLILLYAIITTGYCQNDGIIIFKSELLHEIGDACVSVHNGVEVNGVCQPIQKCPIILANVFRHKYDHAVCGYDGRTQIICCPITNKRGPQLKQAAKINLKQNLECRVVNSNAMGIMKFLSDCPELKKNYNGAHVNKLCTDKVCSDLVCCPATSSSRLKNVCSNVDHPIDTLAQRLLENRECTVKELNITGRYQLSCGFAERNPNLKSLIQNVCNDKICQNWYCCPIENGDVFECTANQISKAIATFVGPKCIDSKSGLIGTCKQLSSASPNRLTLDKCGSYCCNDFYCHPDDLPAFHQPISFSECSSYTKYLSKEEIEVPMNLYADRSICPIRYQLLVAGGINARPGEFPHMAALGYKLNQNIEWNCAGSLISNQYILTAAHCLTDRQIGPVHKVRLGVIDLQNDVDTADCPEDFDVANLIPHPEYKSKFVYNDIGLIELATQVKFNYHIRPICLPPSEDLLQYYLSMGWGATGSVELNSATLVGVNQELFTYEECQTLYNVGRRHPYGIMNDTHICAGSKNTIQSTCPGDSGGPLIVRSTHNSLFYIYGIVSFGTACGFRNTPGVYTKVFPYVKWIEETVWKNELF